MAASYWDYPGSTTGYYGGTGTGYGSTNSTTTTTTSTGQSGYNHAPRYYYSNQCGTTTGGQLYYIPVVKKVLVECPEHWTESDVADFVFLVNDETQTGWTIDMVISGDIKITEPGVEKRSLVDFLPLLKQRASVEDKMLINKFFLSHPLVVED